MSNTKRPQTINFENGVKDEPTFSIEEMHNRVARLRAHMAQASLDAALFTSIHNINIAAGCPPCRAQ